MWAVLIRQMSAQQKLGARSWRVCSLSRSGRCALKSCARFQAEATKQIGEFEQLDGFALAGKREGERGQRCLGQV